MDEPQIRYARTSDGVNIAYWAIGSGVPVVIIDLPSSNIAYEWSIPETRAGYETIAGGATLVRYDHRGFGLSDTWTREFTTEAFVTDLEAVVDKLDLQRFLLIATRGSTYPIALAYARSHPERLIRLAAVMGGPPAEFVDALLVMPGTDYRFMLEALARRITGWDDADAAASFAELLEQSTDLDGLSRFVKWYPVSGIRDRLEQVNVPTLLLPVTFSIGSRSIDEARQLAAQMPDATVHPITGTTNGERSEQGRQAITAFFLQTVERAPPRTRELPSGNAVVLFIDIADSTALTERLGDARFREASRSLDEQLRAAIREHAGTPVDGKVLGDGVMGVFSSAREAIAAALACRDRSNDSELALHIGLHAGDVIRESDNVYGGTVNIASRICSLSAPGEVLVSDVVRGMARSSAGVTFEDRGEYEMKGVGEPVRVYAVVAAAP